MHTQTQRHTQMRTQTHPGNLCSVLESQAPESSCLQVSCKLGLQREPNRQLWAWEPMKAFHQTATEGQTACPVWYRTCWHPGPLVPWTGRMREEWPQPGFGMAEERGYF